MYGKHFASMYEGSMVGAGAVVFAVMGYIIAKAEPDRVVGTQVELNPKLLAMILGEEEKEVADAINRLCSPDPSSRTPDKEGRRLIKIGTFAYQVVNGTKYRSIRDDEERRRQNREAQQRYRAKKGGSKREEQFEKTGDDRLSDPMHDKPVEHSPPGPPVDNPSPQPAAT